MTELDHRAKEPVSAALTGPYGHPFHPILVTVPIGAWVSSVVLDVASHVVDDGATLATGARWLLGIGVLGALAAATVGLLDFTAIPRGTPAHRTAVAHLSLNLLVTVAFALDLWWRVAGGPADGATPFGPLALSVVAAGLLAVSGSLGGRLSYRYGVRVADESVQAAGFTAAAPPQRPPSGRHGD